MSNEEHVHQLDAQMRHRLKVELELREIIIELAKRIKVLETITNTCPQCSGFKAQDPRRENCKCKPFNAQDADKSTKTQDTVGVSETLESPKKP